MRIIKTDLNISCLNTFLKRDLSKLITNLEDCRAVLNFKNFCTIHSQNFPYVYFIYIKYTLNSAKYNLDWEL